MTKQKIFILIPIAIIGMLIIYCWFVILTTNILASWEHYIGLILFIILIILYFIKIRFAVIATGVYLIIGVFNFLSFTPERITAYLFFGSLETPHLQLLSLGLLVFYLLLNNRILIDMYFDRKEKVRDKSI